jgi:RNase adapter protein RapZ
MLNAEPFDDERPRIALITGMSGSGKSVALNALEDAGYHCVDNLPPELLTEFIEVERDHKVPKMAVSVDARSLSSLPALPQLMRQIASSGVQVKLIFLDASDETLIHRFSETRRRHPLSNPEHEQHVALAKAISVERELLQDLRALAHVLDTSLLRTTQLQSSIKTIVAAPETALTLVFESFAFKRGVPSDADFVFDVRMLPNPHYERELRPLTGLDMPVAEFLASKPEVSQMFDEIAGFLTRWLPHMRNDHRAYVTVAVGCTGGQHRSVYLVERLAEHFGREWRPIKRHREVAVSDFSLTRW